MKTIKFRAWDEKKKKMFYSNDIHNQIGISFDGKIINYHEQESGYYPYVDNLELMQSTGLKDMNGKEIYDGDILHSKTWENSRTLNPYHIVEWGEIGWKAKGYNGQIEVKPDLNVKNDFEIIGNIHQDKHLLK